MIKNDIFLVQVGHHGLSRAKKAVDKKYADGVILSPSDYSINENIEASKSIHSKKGIILFDNHWYFPKSKRKKILLEYNYFKDFGGDKYKISSFDNDETREKFCNEVISTQDDISVDAYISPSVYIDTYSKTKIERFILFEYPAACCGWDGTTAERR